MDNPNNTLLPRMLTYAGVLPFILAIIYAALRPMALNASGILLYSAIIISFLSGIHWAIYLLRDKKFSINLFITSNIMALLAWVTSLPRLKLNEIAFSIHILCFLFLLEIDKKLERNEMIPTWFLRLRKQATYAVTICILIIVFQYQRTMPI